MDSNRSDSLPPKKSSGLMRKLKWLLLVIALALTTIVAFQNLDTIDTKFLFITISMPQAALLLSTLLVGFLLGLSATAMLKVRSWRTRPKA